MGQQVRVADCLEFYEKALVNPNVKGNFNPNRIMRIWDFKQKALDATNEYTTYVDTTSTVAVGAGGCVLTTAATDTKVASVTCGGIYWLASKNAAVEFLFQIDVITNVAIYAGFSDAASEGSGDLPVTISGGSATYTADNQAGFVRDTAQTAAYFNIANAKATTGAFSQLSSSHVPVVATDLRLMVRLDTSGNARYYWNGTEIGYKASAVTATTNLIPYFGIRNRTATAHIAKLRRVIAWEDL